MKIGILADIHGNVRALQAVIKVFSRNGVEKIFCLGDMIGYYHNSVEVLELLMDSDVSCIVGNHEGYLLGYAQCPPEKWRLCFLQAVKEKISPKQLSWLSALPKTLEISLDGKTVAFFHGSPWDPLEEYMYPDSPGFSRFGGLSWDYVFLGHTHYFMQRKINRVNIINPGSCGQPRDGGLESRAVILDVKNGELAVVREPYDILKTIEEAKLAGVYPESLEILEGTKR